MRIHDNFKIHPFRTTPRPRIRAIGMPKRSFRGIQPKLRFKKPF